MVPIEPSLSAFLWKPLNPSGKPPGFTLEESTLELFHLGWISSMVSCRTIANLPNITSPFGQLPLPTPTVHPSPLYRSPVPCPSLCAILVPSSRWLLTPYLTTGHRMVWVFPLWSLWCGGHNKSALEHFIQKTLPVFPLLSSLGCVCAQTGNDCSHGLTPSGFWRRRLEEGCSISTILPHGNTSAFFSLSGNQCHFH